MPRCRKLFAALMMLVLIVSLLPSHVLAESKDQTTHDGNGTPAVTNNSGQAPSDEPANNEGAPETAGKPSQTDTQTDTPTNGDQPKPLSTPQLAQDEPVLKAQENKAIEEQTHPSESEWFRDTIAMTPNGQIVVDNAFTLRNCTINSNMTAYDYAIDVKGGSFAMEGGIFQYPSQAAKGIVCARLGTSATLSTVSINGGVPSDFGGANIIGIEQDARVTLGGHAARINYFKNAAIQNDGSFVVSQGSEAHFLLNTITLKGSGTPLTVESGATLTIYKSTITMQDNQGIVVKSGGKLVLDGATIVAAGSRIPITVEKGGVLEVRNGTSFQNSGSAPGSAVAHPGVHKLWELGDSEPPSGLSIAVRLYSGPSADDQQFTGATAWIDAAGGWTADFGDWPAYWDSDEKVPAVYSVREVDDSGQDVMPGSIALIGGTQCKASYTEPRSAFGSDVTTFNVTNTRIVTTTVSLEATKTLVGRELANGEFTFRLRGATGELLQEKTNDVDGLVLFDPVTLPGPGTYAYTVEEVPGNESGLTYDTSRHEANVTVTQAEDGSLATNVAYKRDGSDVGAIGFQNEAKVTKTYEPVSDTIVATKTLEGRPLEAGEFTFHLDDAHGESMQSKTNDANGIVVFDELVFDAPGTYVYHVREDENNPAIAYDSAYHVVTFHVHDAGDGKLVVQRTVELDGKQVDALAFDNVVDGVSEHEPVLVALEATKTLEGRTLKDGEFSFLLDDAHGETIQTKTNDVKGSVSFDPLSVNKPGTYAWVIHEVVGDEKGMTYDERVFDAIAKVEEGSDGKLVVRSITYTTEGNEVNRASFVNKCKADSSGGGDTPAKEDSSAKTATGRAATAKTGDPSLLPGALLCAALWVSCAGTLARKS